MKVSSSRLDLMDTVTVDGVQEKDPLTMRFDEFELQRVASRHTVQQSEVNRPDLISGVEYGAVHFWWFILETNGVVDPWEIPEDVRLTVPQILDYYDWFRQQKEST
jgi:hypothetical protein